MERRVSKCPACGSNDFKVARLVCKSCGTAIEGNFGVSKLAHLSQEHQEFVEIFLKCRGNIKDVERELGISYPTVRSRLEKINQQLGHVTEAAAGRRKEILQALERNEIAAEEALKALRENEG
jgi:hypothetical protein